MNLARPSFARVLLALVGLLGWAGSSNFILTLLPTASNDVPTGKEQAILVLSGTRPRIEEAIRLQRATRLPILVVGTGAPNAIKRIEAAGGHGKALENKSWDTERNAAYAACLVSPAQAASVFLVTDRSHMPRASAWFAYYGVHVTRHVDDATGPVWHEWGGLLEFWFKRLAGYRVSCPALS
jgi:uncharacterized SAM-binding protein YcdF (DUF218 family)